MQSSSLDPVASERLSHAEKSFTSVNRPGESGDSLI
ncbi:Uncharacterised protein [Mycobacterium tuberculosis]|nr:Uncharacterised protein [Mycobacterium tuberculosis]